MDLLVILNVVIGVSLVIFVHELGHFAVAKWAGVKVERFSIGFPMPNVGWKAIPVGAITGIVFKGRVALKTYPDRVSGPGRRMDFTQRHAWHFEPPDFEKFPALELGYEAARRGGTAGAVLNAITEPSFGRGSQCPSQLAAASPAGRDLPTSLGYLDR